MTILFSVGTKIFLCKAKIFCCDAKKNKLKNFSQCTKILVRDVRHVGKDIGFLRFAAVLFSVTTWLSGARIYVNRPTLLSNLFFPISVKKNVTFSSDSRSLELPTS